MKKLFLLFLFMYFTFSPVFAINFGHYKSETDYGLIDGFKWNFFNREENQPLVQVKSETQEEKIRIEKEKAKPKQEQDDVQLYKFMIDNVVAF